jgi:hypothetical protein
MAERNNLLTDSSEAMRQAVATVQSEKVRLETELSELTLNSATTTRKFNQLTVQYEQQTEDNTALNAQIRALRTELNETRANKDGSEDQVQQLTHQLDEERRLRKELQKTNADISDRLQKSQDRIVVLEKDLENSIRARDQVGGRGFFFFFPTIILLCFGSPLRWAVFCFVLLTFSLSLCSFLLLLPPFSSSFPPIGRENGSIGDRERNCSSGGQGAQIDARTRR